MSRIYWDTMLLIYWLEEHPTHIDGLKRLLLRMEMRGDRLCSSAFGLGEVWSVPESVTTSGWQMQFEPRCSHLTWN